MAAWRGDLTLNEVATKYEVHANQVSALKKELLEAARDSFSDGRVDRKKDEEELVTRLYQEIGRLKVELDWLRKKVGDFE